MATRGKVFRGELDPVEVGCILEHAGRELRVGAT